MLQSSLLLTKTLAIRVKLGMKCSKCGNDVTSMDGGDYQDDEDREGGGRFALEKEFVSDTSCHGISFWNKSKHVVQRIFWVLLVLGMTAGVIQQVLARILNYYEYKTTSSTSREFVSSIEYPAVTICNFNRLFYPSSEQEKQAMRLLNTVTNPPSFEYAKAINLPIDFTRLNTFWNDTNFSISDYYERKGYGWNDNIQLLDCIFASTFCSAANFTPVLTNQGKCYTFNANKSVQQNQTVGGIGNGLYMLINVQHWDYTEEPLFGNNEAGIQFQVHNKGETPNVKNFGIAVPVGRKAYALLNRVDSEVMYQPWGKCNPENEKVLRYFTSYTLDSCMRECYTQTVIDECGCHHFDQTWARGQVPECTLDQTINCSSPVLARILPLLSPELCNCTIPCSFTEYPIRMSYSYVPIRDTVTFFQVTQNISAEFIGQNILALDVSFENIGYKKEVESKQVDEGGLLSDVGGQLGLWIGMSFITIVEFAQYFVTRVLFCFKTPKSKSSGEKNRSKERKEPVTVAWNGKTNNGFQY